MGWPILYYFTQGYPLFRNQIHTCWMLIVSGGTLIYKKYSDQIFSLGLLYITQHYFFESIYNIYYFESFPKTLTLHHIISGILTANLLNVNITTNLNSSLYWKLSLLNFLFELPNLGLNLVRMSKYADLYQPYLPFNIRQIKRMDYQFWASLIFILCRGFIGIPLIGYWFFYQPIYSSENNKFDYWSMLIQGCWIFKIFLNLNWSWRMLKILRFHWKI